MSVDPVQAEWYDEWLALFASRDEVAEHYADLISNYGGGWNGYKPINEAILRRWSPAALLYIKQKAWRLAGGGTQP